MTQSLIKTSPNWHSRTYVKIVQRQENFEEEMYMLINTTYYIQRNQKPERY